MAKKYTITNPNYLVEEYEGNLRELVNVRGELKELVNTSTTNSILERLEQLEECCENPPTPPIPTGDGVNVIELGFGDWWHYSIFELQTNFKVQCSNLISGFTFGESEVDGDNQYQITNISLIYDDHNGITLTFDAVDGNRQETHCEYTSENTFLEGKFSKVQGTLPDELHYKFNYIDLSVNGSVDLDKTNVCKFVYTETIHDEDVELEVYSLANIGLQGEYFLVDTQYDLTPILGLPMILTLHFDNDDVSRCALSYTATQMVQELETEIISIVSNFDNSLKKRLWFKGKYDNLGNIPTEDTGANKIYVIQNPFFAEDSLKLGMRLYPEGSLCIVTNEEDDIEARDAMISITFEDNSNCGTQYTIGLFVVQGTTTLDFNDINNQLSGEWYFSTTKEGFKDSDYIYNIDTDGANILVTVVIDFNNNVSEYSGNSTCSYTIIIKDGLDITGTITNSDLSIDYTHKQTANCYVRRLGYTSAIEQHQEYKRYFIPGLQ